MSAGKVYLRPIAAADTAKIVAWRNKDFVRGNFIYQKLFTEEDRLRPAPQHRYTVNSTPVTPRTMVAARYPAPAACPSASVSAARVY